MRIQRKAVLLLPLLIAMVGGTAGPATAIQDRLGHTVKVNAVSQRAALVAPANGARVTDIVLRWNRVAGVGEYDVQVSPNRDWANNLSFAAKVQGLQYSPPVTLKNASYFWRVRTSAGKTKGPWSGDRLFHRVWNPVPQLRSPADGKMDVATPTFSWTPVSHASRYELQVGRDVNFSPKTYNVCYTDHTTFTPYTSVLPRQAGCTVDPAPGQRYFWRVRGIDDPAPVFGRWSATASFMHRKPLPTMTSPSNGASTSAPVLTWQPVGDSEQYVVTIRKRSGAVAETGTTWGTSYSPLKTLLPADSPFTWSVQTKEKNGHLGLAPDRSQWQAFTLTKPSASASAPSGLTVASQPTSRPATLTWNPVAGATSYTVFYERDGVYTPLHSKIPFAALTDPDRPVATGDFKWFVEAYGPRDTFLGRSDESVFTVTENPLATYTAPCVGSQTCAIKLDTPTMRWQSVERAGYYRVYVALDRNFTNVVKEYVTQYTELTPRESLLDNQAGQSYYWFARACSGDLCGPFGEEQHPTAGTFRKKTPPVVGLKVYASPGSTAFAWSNYAKARQYRVQVATTPAFSTLVDQVIVDQTTYAAFAKTYPRGKPLYVRVQAIDGSKNLLTTSGTAGFWPR